MPYNEGELAQNATVRNFRTVQNKGMTMKNIAALLLAAISATATASDIELTIGGWSKHLGAPDGYEQCNNNGCQRVWDWKHYYNETHNTIAVKYKSFEVGTLINSHHKRSFVFSWIPRWDVNEYFSYGVRVGGATGYEGKAVSPVFQPHVVVYYKAVGIELGWLPDMNSRHPYGVATLTGKVRF